MLFAACRKEVICFPSCGTLIGGVFPICPKGKLTYSLAQAMIVQLWCWLNNYI